MPLRGKKPKESSPRLRLLMFGPAGVGKTTAALQMPKPYVIDTEGGCDHYGAQIEAVDGAVFKSNNLEDVTNEVRALATESHEYCTLVIDSFTPLYETQLERGEEIEGNEFGRHYGYANKRCKRLFNLLTMIDMNVVVTCHSKNKYGSGMEVVGQTFDGWKKLDYLFDLAVLLEKHGPERLGLVVKTRFTEEFPDGLRFPWSYAELAQRYGREKLEKMAEAVVLATPDDVAKLEALVARAGVSDEVVAKWIEKAGVPGLIDMKADQIGRCIEYCNNLLEA